MLLKEGAGLTGLMGSSRQEAEEWLGMSSPGSQLMDYDCHELTRTDLQEYQLQAEAVHASGRNKCLPASIKQLILDEIGAVTHVLRGQSDA